MRTYNRRDYPGSEATMRRSLLAIAALVTLATAPRTQAGIADSPLPAGTTLHLFSIPGAIRITNLETAITCTSYATSNVTVAVEFFAGAGGAPLNNAPGGNGMVTLVPGGTALFSSGSIAGLVPDETITSLPSFNGSARVATSSKMVECSAMMVSSLGSPPTSMVSLPVIYKLKQKGD